jgi:hypothetical protein
MKKLTAGIFATLLAVVSADGAYAAIASKGYVDDKVGTVTTELGNKADKTAIADMLTKTEAGTTYATKESIADMETKSNASATYATKSEVSSLSREAEKIANRVTTVSDASDNTHYPTAKAVWDVVQAETSDIASSGDLSALTTRVGTLEKASATHATKTELTDGLDEKLDTTTATTTYATKTELATKQDKNMGSSAANSIVTTDGTGNITASATIAASKVDGLANVAKSGAYSDLSGRPTIPTVDAAITEDSTNAVQSGAVYDALATKANSADIPTTVAGLTDAGNYALVSTMNTELGKKQNSLTETQLNAVNSGITTTKVATYDGYAAKITANTEAIATKANSADVYTKTTANSTFIPRPGTNCTATGAKCVLVTNGTNFEWEVIARDGEGQ